MIRAQMLSELEEIIQYKQYADQPDRQESMKRMWMKRFVVFVTYERVIKRRADYTGVNLRSSIGNESYKSVP